MEASKIEIVGNKISDMYQVKLELSHVTDRFSSLFFFFTEMWLMCNCKNLWYMEKVGTDPVNIVVSFQDPKEAIFFKLSKQFDRARQEQLRVSAYTTNISVYFHRSTAWI